MSTPKFIQSKCIIIISALAFCAVALVSAQTRQPPAASNPMSDFGSKKLVPDSGNVDSAQVPDEPGTKEDPLIALLKEQNRRLKARVERLERENAELKAKLAEKQ